MNIKRAIEYQRQPAVSCSSTASSVISMWNRLFNCQTIILKSSLSSSIRWTSQFGFPFEFGLGWINSSQLIGSQRKNRMPLTDLCHAVISQVNSSATCRWNLDSGTVLDISLRIYLVICTCYRRCLNFSAKKTYHSLWRTSKQQFTQLWDLSNHAIVVSFS